jgi:hypothetical protein
MITDLDGFSTSEAEQDGARGLLQRMRATACVISGLGNGLGLLCIEKNFSAALSMSDRLLDGG